jgi:iron complex transport system substrate-binding protein
MKRMRVPQSALLFGSLIAATVLGGCKPTMQPGIKVGVRKPNTVVSLSPSASELVSLCYPKMVGRTSKDDYPPMLKNVEVVANIKPDYEKIASLKPDFIVYDPSIYNAQDIEKLKALKIPLLTIDGDTVEEYIKSVYRLGQALQSEAGLMDYQIKLDQEISVCRSDPIKPVPKIAIVLNSPNTSQMVAGTKSFYCDVVRIAGGEPVGPDSNKFETMSPEALLALNPDGIVLPMDKGDKDTFMTDPRFSQLKAVKNGKVMMMLEEYILRRGERVDEALKRLHDAFIKLFK